MVISLSRDANRIAVIGGTSSVDGTSPVAIFVDPVTHRLKVDASSTANLIVGTSTITGGSTGQVLYDNGGVLGEMTTTGSGTVNVLQTSPTLITPVLGIATATSLNGLTITSSTGILTITNLKTLSISNSLTLTGTDGSSIAFGTGGTVLYNGGALGTPSSGTATNLTGTAAGLTAGTVTTNANLTGAITSSGNATSLGSFSSSSLAAALTDETGTGVTVFATSPTLIAPALGTPTALVGTNITGTGASFTSGITQALASATTTVNVSSATAPTTGQVLTATGGTAATWQTPSGGLPKMLYATVFESTGRFGTTFSGGTTTFNTNGVVLDTTATSNRYAEVYISSAGGGLAVFNPWSGSPTFSFSGTFSVLGAGCTTYIGIGPVIVSGSGQTFTNKHIGFKIVGTMLSATQADGTTENTSSLATLAAGDGLDLILQVNSTTSVTYYYRQNGGALSAGTTVTGNVPTGDPSGTLIDINTSNAGNAARVLMSANSASYQR